MSAKSDLNKIFQRITDTVEDLATSNQLRVLGREAGRLIKQRTRFGGKGSVDVAGANLGKLKNISKTTKKYRDFYRSIIHSSAAGGSKSNLTFTGQLLDSMKVRVLNKTKVEIGPAGPRKPFRGFGLTKRKRTSTTPSNEQVAEFVSEERPFNHLSKLEQGKLVKFYQRTFDRLLTFRQLT